MKNFVFVIVLLFPVFAVADDTCMEKAVSDPEINECASQEFDDAEAVLNSTYKEVIIALGKEETSGPKAKQALVTAQRQWVAFRKSDCDAVYILNQDGSVRTPAFFTCMTSRAKQRTKELHEFVQ